MEQLIDEQTRYREGQTPSLLDLLIVSDPDIVSNLSYCDPFGKSDHITICFDLRNKFSEEFTGEHRRDFKNVDDEIFRQEIAGHDWNETLNRDEINSVYDGFIAVVENAISKAVPLQTNTNRKKAPWERKHQLKKLATKKRNKWDKYKFSKSSEDYIEYRSVLNEFTDEKEKAVLNYETKIITGKNTNSKRYYRYVSRKKKYNSNKINLLVNDEVVTDDQLCAEELNNYFCSVLTKGPSPHQDFHATNSISPMPEIEFTLENVKNKLENLEIDKSPGPDGIPPFILKIIADLFAPVLVEIFRKSYECGIVPVNMKVANIVPLFKKGNRSSASNYRPVSLTPIVAKIFEKIVHENILHHIESHNIITNAQHGFRKEHSTNSNLLNMWNDLSKLANNTKEVIIIYTDFTRAFDTVPHDS